MAEAAPKVAILSQVLPPSPSGQAMVLAALLSYLDPADYCLISQEPHSAGDHAANYYPLVFNSSGIWRLLRRLPNVNPNKRTVLHRTLRPLLRTYHRLRSFGTLTGSYATVLEAYVRQLEAIIEREGCGLIVACTGEPFNLPAAYTVSQRTGIPFVSYIFDDYGYQWTGDYRAFALEWEPKVLQAARAVVVTNEFMARAYQDRYGVTSTIVRNPAVLPDLATLDRAPRVLDSDTFNIVYTGSVYSAHYDAFRRLIAALDRLGRPEVRLHVFTSQPASALTLQGVSGPHVAYHAHAAHEEILTVQRQADVLFLPLAFDSPIPEVINTSSPGKLGEYLAAGRPILVNAPPDSFLNWYFREHECGVVVDQADVDAVVAALVQLMDDPSWREALGQRALAHARADFDLAQVSSHFLGVLASAQGTPQ